MTPRRLRILALIILGTIIIGFVLFVPKGKVQSPSAQVPAADALPAVSLSDTFKKGTHTISGSLEVHNACVAVAAEASVINDGATPRGIAVAITRTPSEGICLELPTRITFQKKVVAPKDLPLSATIDGKPVRITNL
jgi:hypothetical protein